MLKKVVEQGKDYYISIGSRVNGDYIRYNLTPEERNAIDMFAAEQHLNGIREEAKEDNEFKSTITASERIEGLTFEMWKDGSGRAEFNGEWLGSIDLATKEIELGGGRDLIMLDSITDEIMSEFREIMERRAIEKGAKKIECTGRTTRCEYRI